jgi:hypothetical protein
MRWALLLFAATACGGNSVTIAMLQQNNSGQDGKATLTETAGGVRVRVVVKRSSVEGSQTSHVHDGRCDNVGAITAGLRPISEKDGDVRLEGDQIVFQNDLTGRKLSDLRDGNHVINVHDARDNSLYVSCGEID